MPFRTHEKKKCDVLVIGSGGAGLRAAIAAASRGADVLMVSKGRIGHVTNTYLSKAVIAASGWGDSNDNSNVHSKDTLEGGRFLNHPGMVTRFTEAIRTETAQLREWGIEFGTDENGKPIVAKIPGHSYARHLYGRNWKGRPWPFKRVWLFRIWNLFSFIQQPLEDAVTVSCYMSRF